MTSLILTLYTCTVVLCICIVQARHMTPVMANLFTFVLLAFQVVAAFVIPFLKGLTQ